LPRARRDLAAGELWITVLDVGQGLAVLARTEKHALLYDAGPAFNAFSDSVQPRDPSVSCAARG